MRKVCSAFVLFILLAGQGFAADPLDKALSNGNIWKAMGILTGSSPIISERY